MTKTKNSNVVVGNVKNRHLLKRLSLTKNAVILLAAGLLIIGAAATYLYIKDRRESDTVVDNAVCSSAAAGSVLKDASNALDPKKVNELAAVAERIQKLPNYQKDQNCLYVVVYYYVNAYRYPEARSNLDQLEKIYDPSKNFLVADKSIDMLREDVKTMELQVEQVKNNVTTVENR